MLGTVSAEPAPKGYEALSLLDSLREEIELTERTLARKRMRRDEAIRTAVQHGSSERAAAAKAGVSASYAHLAAKNGGLTASVLSERRSRAR